MADNENQIDDISTTLKNVLSQDGYPNAVQSIIDEMDAYASVTYVLNDGWMRIVKFVISNDAELEVLLSPYDGISLENLLSQTVEYEGRTIHGIHAIKREQ